MKQSNFYSKPGFRDWALLTTNILFVMMGVFLLFKRQYQIAVPSLAVFGSALAITIALIWRKYRFRRTAPLKVQIVGGVPIYPSRNRTLILGVWIAALGTISIVFGSSFDLLFQMAAGVIAIAGYAILLGVATGYLPRAGYLQFDPAGLTIGNRRWSYLIQWDNIAGLAPVMIDDVPTLYVRLHRPDLIEVMPPEQAEKVRKSLLRRGAGDGPNLTLNPTPYGMDLPLLLQALDRYIRDPSARLDLAPLPALATD